MLIIGSAFLLLMDPSSSYAVVIAVLSLGLAVRGIRYLYFYFSAARYMVGGKMILFWGVITLDFAMLTGSLTDVPKFYVLLYLLGAHAFSGVVEVLRAMEAKRAVGGPWKLKFSHGIVNLAIALACLVLIRRPNTAVQIFSLGLVYSGMMRIIGAFRRTSFILIK